MAGYVRRENARRKRRVRSSRGGGGGGGGGRPIACGRRSLAGRCQSQTATASKLRLKKRCDRRDKDDDDDDDQSRTHQQDFDDRQFCGESPRSRTSADKAYPEQDITQ